MIETMHLSTKFSIPNFNHQKILIRNRLLNKLESSGHARLTMISAPPGYGKTTLLSTYSNFSNKPTAWLDLDRRDNDPLVFTTGFIQAIQTVAEDIGTLQLQILNSDDRPSLEILAEDLILELDSLHVPFELIIDNYQNITNPEIHKFFYQIISHQTPKCRLIISSRNRPPWKLTRWQINGDVFELGLQDLRFSHQEVKAFFNDLCRLALEDSDITSLVEKTEGWIAGLRMVRLSIRDDQSSLANISAFFEPNRLIEAYITEEVLEGQSTEMINFLINTSILGTLSPDLCDHIRGAADSAEILSQLENHNLFVIPLDNRFKLSRYHPLLRQVLNNLRINSKSTISDVMLHIRASEWFEKNNFFDDALHHALCANDISRVLNFVENQSFTSLKHRTLVNLQNWIESAPKDIVANQPWFTIARCWGLALSQRHADLKSQLKELNSQEYVNDHELQGHITALSIYLESDWQKNKHLAETALNNLPDCATTIRVLILQILGDALLQEGDLFQAKDIFGQAIDISKASGDSYQLIKAQSSLSQVYLLKGHQDLALGLLRGAQQTAGEISTQLGGVFPQAAYVFLQLSKLHLEWYNLERANKFIELAYTRVNQLDFPLLFANISLTKAEICLEIGDLIGSRRMLDEIKHLIDLEDISKLSDHLPSYYAQISLRMGEYSEVKKWAANLSQSDDISVNFSSRLGVLTLAWFLLQAKKEAEALQLLLPLSHVCSLNGSVQTSVRAHTLMALAYHQAGRNYDAMTNIEASLGLAAPNRLIKSIVSFGEPLEALLNRAYQLDINPEFSRELLSIIQKNKNPSNYHQTQELLSKREFEILKYLVTELSVPEIAEGLVISAGTVRSHIKRIYRKLDVHSRYDAVEKAKDLNLLLDNDNLQRGKW
jgi:LuxR family maltose regulon positive regulatory protein